VLAFADRDPRRAGTIFARNLDGIAPQVEPQAPATFGRVGLEAGRELAVAMGPGSLPEVNARFERGLWCYASRVGRSLVAYGWVSFREELVGELDLRLNLVPGEAYIWDCATLPAFRGRHLYSALLSFIMHDLYTRPVCRAWIGADLDNQASQRGIVRAGFHPVADLLVERVLGLRLVWAEGHPEVPAGWVAEARRVYLGDREQVWRGAPLAAHRG